MSRKLRDNKLAAKRPSQLKGGEFKREADEANKRQETAPSLSETEWADLSPKEREKRQRG